MVNITGDGCASGPINADDLDETRPGYKAMVGWRGGVDTVTMRSSDYAPGGGLLVGVLVAAKKQDGRVGVGLQALAYRDVSKIPSCVLMPGAPPSPAPS